MARALLFTGMRALLLSSILLSCSLVLAPPPVQASTMHDIARFFGFGSDSGSDRHHARGSTSGSVDSAHISVTAHHVDASDDPPLTTHEAAPEIDAGALTSALALAAGGLVALGVRRRRR